MILEQSDDSVIRICVSRVSGGDPERHRAGFLDMWCFPRERGDPNWTEFALKPRLCFLRERG